MAEVSAIAGFSTDLGEDVGALVSPKNRGPDQSVPVIDLAIFEREA